MKQKQLTEEQLALAATMYADGKGVNTVAKALGVGWNTAKNLQPAADDTSTDDAEESEWEISLRVPKSRVQDIFAAFNPQEQADAVCFVLQSRMDAALEA